MDEVDDGHGTIDGLERSFKGISYTFLDEGFFYINGNKLIYK